MTVQSLVGHGLNNPPPGRQDYGSFLVGPLRQGSFCAESTNINPESGLNYILESWRMGCLSISDCWGCSK